MPDPRTATRDAGLSAIVVARTPLYYAEGADPSLDRPAQVRAGSSLARVPGGLALVQDDANFIALVDPDDARRARAILLAAGEGGRRQFDDRRGNKAHKLDLEACLALDTGDGTLLIALGSGSTAAREQAVLVTGWDSEPRATLVHLPRLYDALRREHAFAGSELNVEGAVHLGDRVRLFGRGNGASSAGVLPVNATCDLDAAALLAHLLAPERNAPPSPTNVIRYELGTLGGLPLSFTDAAVWRDALLYTAAAEDSPDVTRDGRVTGSAIGTIDRDGQTRWAPLSDAAGQPFVAKVEGVVAASATSGASGRLFVVVDADDPDAASELCTVELRGEW